MTSGPPFLKHRIAFVITTPAMIVSKTPDHTDNRAMLASLRTKPIPSKQSGENPCVSALFLAVRGHFGKADMLRSRPGLQAAGTPKNRRNSLILNKYLPT
jgi:hypothetical protein